MRCIIVLGTLALFSGCSAHDVARNLYEGARTHDEIRRSSIHDTQYPRLPGFDEYERERRALAQSRTD